jgi:hypothetical protein
MSLHAPRVLLAALAGATLFVGIHGWWVAARLAELERRPPGLSPSELAVEVLRLETRLAALEEGLRDIERKKAQEGYEGRLPEPEPVAAAEGRPAKPEQRAPDWGAEIAAIRRELAALRKGLATPGDFAFAGEPPADLDLDELAILAAPRGGSSNPRAKSWSPEQVLGEPDSQAGGDHATAWATLQENAGLEWIEVEFANPVAPRGVLIRETFNPGAVVRVEAADLRGRYHLLWEGDDPTRAPGGNFVIFIEPGYFATRAVRVTLDTAKVSGWNEIDAIGLIGASRIHWAAAASASSTYASR